ncbi:hypothetical protein N2152v2_010284 [Parachlorella kessleri]
MTGIRGALRAAYQQTRAGFSSLSGSPRDLYIIFAVKVLESYNYFSLSRSMTLYLTEEFGISDYRAGTLYGLWGTLLTAYGFLLGGAIDILGVKLSLILCFLLNIGSRFVMASTNSPWLMLVMLFGPNTIAGALGVPVMTIGVKRFTHENNRGFAFSLFYSLMNVAALAQGMLMDVFRLGLKHGFNLPSFGEHSLLNSGFRMFLASGAIVSVEETLLEHGTAAEGLGGMLVARKRLHDDAQLSSSSSEHGSPSKVKLRGKLAAGLEAVKAVLASRGFWKYMCMCVFTVNLKSIFRHLDATLPKMQLRAFGCDTPIGLIYSINPAMIVLLVPVVGAMTTGFQHFDMIHLGGYISALSPFWIVAFNTEWSTALFVAMLSLGEAVWSPRWYDYSMSIAPEGREGVFTALASAPLFAAMLPTGVPSVDWNSSP